MSLRLGVLKAGVIGIFITVAFVFSVVMKDEDRLLSEVNKVFARLFLIGGFFELDFLCEIMMITIQFTM